MNVKDLIGHLTAYTKKSPENSHAEVMLQSFDETCYGILGANDAKSIGDLHLLIIVPDLRDTIGVRDMKVIQ